VVLEPRVVHSIVVFCLRKEIAEKRNMSANLMLAVKLEKRLILALEGCACKDFLAKSGSRCLRLFFER